MEITTNNIEQSPWNRRISLQNVRSYAKAAVELYETLTHLEKENYEAAVFPSRGTTPFRDLLWNVHLSRKQHGPMSFWHRWNIPFGDRTINLPFTADPPEGTVNGSAQIRDYWVRVLRAILEQDSTSVELRYHQYCLNNIFGFERHYGLPIKRAGQRFVFVDTVVSGQAVCEIISSFKTHGLEDFYLVLLMDENGRKLKPHYRKAIDELKRQGKVKLIDVDLLFTEDEGPAFTSTWCLSSPQLVKAASEFIDPKPTAKAMLVGTAISFVRVQADVNLDNSSSTYLRASLKAVLSNAMNEHFAEEKVRSLYTHGLERSRLDLVATIHNQCSECDPLSKKETERIARNAIRARTSIGVSREPIRLKVENIDVSSSHVVRLYFNSAFVNRHLQGYAKYRAPALLSIHDP